MTLSRFITFVCAAYLTVYLSFVVIPGFISVVIDLVKL